MREGAQLGEGLRKLGKKILGKIEVGQVGREGGEVGCGGDLVVVQAQLSQGLGEGEDGLWAKSDEAVVVQVERHYRI